METLPEGTVALRVRRVQLLPLGLDAALSKRAQRLFEHLGVAARHGSPHSGRDARARGLDLRPRLGVDGRLRPEALELGEDVARAERLRERLVTEALGFAFEQALRRNRADVPGERVALGAVQRHPDLATATATYRGDDEAMTVFVFRGRVLLELEDERVAELVHRLAGDDLAEAVPDAEDAHRARERVVGEPGLALAYALAPEEERGLARADPESLAREAAGERHLSHLVRRQRVELPVGDRERRASHAAEHRLERRNRLERRRRVRDLDAVDPGRLE